VFYKAVTSHPIFEDLKKLFLKTVALGDAIRHALTPINDKIHASFIFGSIAQGNESIDSDIDLFILGEISLRELSRTLAPISKKLKRELNPVVFGLSEFKKRLSHNDHFLLEITSKPNIWIAGDENEFARMVKGRKVKKT
jgi:predicted nucleotidyltransferase